MARILVVDDEPTIVGLVETVLASAGHDVRTAPDGNRGLAAFEKSPPELLILDWMMPDLSGIQVLAELGRRQLRGKSRVVMLTAKVTERDILRGWQAGVDAYITKPFDVDKFIAAVDDVLAATPDDLEKGRKRELDRAGLLRALDDMLDP